VFDTAPTSGGGSWIKKEARGWLGSPLLRRNVAAFTGATGVQLRCLPAEPTAEELALALHGTPFLDLVMRTGRGKPALLKPILALCARAAREQIAEEGKGLYGFTYVAIPLPVEGVTRAILLAGPMAHRLADVAACRKVTDELVRLGSHVGVEKIAAAYRAVTVVRGRRRSGTVALLTLLAGALVQSPLRWLPRSNEHDDPCVAQAKAFLQTHALGESSLQDVAGHVHLSRDYLGRAFLKATDMTVGEYVARMRVERVKQMLPDRSRRVIEAAFAAGFQSVAQFNRVFKRYAGVSPSQYRLSLKL
jgi:AraC-like DNA-binding protein